jgi:hypothetical protein
VPLGDNAHNSGPERQAEVVRRASGIPLVQAVVDDLRDIALRTGIAFD